MDLTYAFGLLHSRVHGGDLYGRPSLADRVFGDLTDEQMRARPAKGVNSLIWILWHISRGTQLFVSAADHNARHIGEAITVRGLGGFGLAM